MILIVDVLQVGYLPVLAGYKVTWSLLSEKKFP